MVNRAMNGTYRIGVNDFIGRAIGHKVQINLRSLYGLDRPGSIPTE